MKNKLTRMLLAGLFLAMSMLTAVAAEKEDAASTMDTMVLRIALDKLMPGIVPDSINKTPIEGLYEVAYGATIFYFNKDASYMMKGDLVEMKTRTNLTEKTRAKARVAKIEEMGEENMIIFRAKNEKYKVTVFTDIDCPYCVKLHRQMPEYNKRGITVRYMAYPRAGIGSSSYEKIVSVWCSKDRNQAMTDSKNGKPVKQATCDNPVARQFELGQILGIRGTPAIFLADGTMLPGYVPPDQLEAVLKQQ